MLPAPIIPALVCPPCPSLPYTFHSATWKQRHKIYHLPLGFVSQYLSLYRFLCPSTYLAPSRPLIPALSRSLTQRPACPPHPRHHNCSRHRQVGPCHSSAHMDPPSVHHHSHHLCHPDSVVTHPGSRLGSTAAIVVAQWLPWDHHYSTQRNAYRWLEPLRAGCLGIRAIDLIPEGTGVYQLQLFIWSQVLPNFGPIYERNTAHHSRTGELLLLLYSHISWNCNRGRVATGSRDIISLKRSQALISLTLQTFHICGSPRMCSQTNSGIWCGSPHQASICNRCQHFPLPVASTFPFQLPFGAIAASWQWIIIWGVSIIIWSNIAERLPEWTYKVVSVIRCIVEQQVMLWESHVLSR